LFICSEISEDVAGFCGLIDLVNLIVDVLLGHRTISWVSANNDQDADARVCMNMILVKHDAEKAKALDTRKTVRKPCPRASIQIEPPAFSTLKRIDRCQQLGSSYNPASQHRMPCDVQSWSDMQKEHIFHKQSLKDLTALPLHACKGMQRAHTTSGS
jgi:hypothetical protein